MIERRVSFYNNTSYSIYIADISPETTGGGEGCYWSTGLPAEFTVLTPGEGFQAAVLFETVQDTQCSFQVNRIDHDGTYDAMFDAWVNIEVNAIDQIIPTLSQEGIDMVPTFNGSGDLISVSYVDPPAWRHADNWSDAPMDCQAASTLDFGGFVGWRTL